MDSLAGYRARSNPSPAGSLLARGLLQHGRCLLFLEFLEALLLLQGPLFLVFLLCLLLSLQAPLFLLPRALHTALRVGLVAEELLVHALRGDFPRAACLLDTVAVVLVHLVVARVILGLGHLEGEMRRARLARAIHKSTSVKARALSQNGYGGGSCTSGCGP